MTGSTSGCGYELAKMLYRAGAKVYIASRSPEKVKQAIKTIKSDGKSSSGKLIALHLDLSDLSSIKQSANEFLAAEERLDVLVHNAGIMTPPTGSKTKLVSDSFSVAFWDTLQLLTKNEGTRPGNGDQLPRPLPIQPFLRGHLEKDRRFCIPEQCPDRLACVNDSGLHAGRRCSVEREDRPTEGAQERDGKLHGVQSRQRLLSFGMCQASWQRRHHQHQREPRLVEDGATKTRQRRAKLRLGISPLSLPLPSLTHRFFLCFTPIITKKTQPLLPLGPPLQTRQIRRLHRDLRRLLTPNHGQGEWHVHHPLGPLRTHPGSHSAGAEDRRRRRHRKRGTLLELVRAGD